jgi:hypothetical protein
LDEADFAKPKAGPKATRRLSARFTNWAKGLGKKDQPTTPRDEVPQEAVELKGESDLSTATSSSVIANEAPQLEKPVEVEPLKIEEVSLHQTHNVDRSRRYSPLHHLRLLLHLPPHPS